VKDYLNDTNYNSKEKKQWYGSSVRSVYLKTNLIALRVEKQ
jgi:hypothetical protein